MRSRRWTILALAALGALGLFAPATAPAGHGMPAVVASRGELEREIRAELPVGSPRARVTAFRFDAVARLLSWTIEEVSRIP